MATDALVAGFEETMWIESDIVFEPDAVERLRKRQLPICCAIYPQKGRRVLACHVIPGTKTMLFGKSGFADTSIRVWHVGNYSYDWEDSGIRCSRYDDFTLNL